MKKLITLLIVCQIGFTQSEKKQNDITKIIKKEKGFKFQITPAVSYFGNSVKTHWEMEAGWLSKKGNGLTIGLEGMIDSRTFNHSISSYNQQTAFINLEFIFTEIWNNDAEKYGISFGWLVKDDANIFHKGGNVDCFRLKYTTSFSNNICVFGAYYFDKDDQTGERHDLPSVGISYGF